MEFKEIAPLVLGELFAFVIFNVGISQWRQRKTCKEQIEGICIEKVQYNPPTMNTVYYKIRFSYMYNGKKYAKYSVEQFHSKKMSEFEVGKTYPLYVNPKKPQSIRCTNQMLTANDVFCIIFGGFFLLGLLGMMIQQIFLWIS